MVNKNISHVFAGCCASAFLMELLMAKASQSANLVTFIQFLFISVQGFIITTKFGRVKPNIPLQRYALLVTLFFVTSVANNYVYALHVPSTLHMIIRSASSPASMLVSWIYKKRPPKFNNVLGSILITIGVASAMYGGASIVENTGHFMSWSIGVFILLSMLILGAFTGLQQEILYSKYGKHPEEMMFYTHCIPLPFFLTIYPQMRDVVTTLGPEVWLLISINMVSQYYCTHSVHNLATKDTSVTVTFILTLRKFVSLIISSVVFKNTLTVFHMLGTVSVIFGTYVYFDYFSFRKQKSVSIKDR